MNADTPRLRMFAGPNGSGKTTVKSQLPAQLFNNYINPDDLEKSLRTEGELDLNAFGISVDAAELKVFFSTSDFLKTNGLEGIAALIDCREGIVSLEPTRINSYVASVLSDFSPSETPIRSEIVHVRNRHVCP